MDTEILETNYEEDPDCDKVAQGGHRCLVVTGTQWEREVGVGVAVDGVMT